MSRPSDETRRRFLSQQQRGLDELSEVESPLAEFLRIVCDHRSAPLRPARCGDEALDREHAGPPVDRLKP